MQEFIETVEFPDSALGESATWAMFCAGIERLTGSPCFTALDSGEPDDNQRALFELLQSACLEHDPDDDDATVTEWATLAVMALAVPYVQESRGQMPLDRWDFVDTLLTYCQDLEPGDLAAIAGLLTDVPCEATQILTVGALSSLELSTDELSLLQPLAIANGPLAQAMAACHPAQDSDLSCDLLVATARTQDPDQFDFLYSLLAGVPDHFHWPEMLPLLEWVIGEWAEDGAWQYAPTVEFRMALAAATARPDVDLIAEGWNEALTKHQTWGRALLQYLADNDLLDDLAARTSLRNLYGPITGDEPRLDADTVGAIRTLVDASGWPALRAVTSP